MNKAKVFFIIGVSGSGKSTIGEMAASNLNLLFKDGDSYHNEENVIKMSSGIPLQDVDRWGWLEKLNQIAKEHINQNQSVIIACSALKAIYRTMLAKGIEHNTHFVFLDGPQAVISQRIKEREHFFCGDDMLNSQFLALELPSKEEAKFVDITQDFDAVLEECKNFIEVLIK